MIGHPELIVVGAIILVLFGASAIPKFARSIGRAKAEFEKGSKEGATAELEERQEEETAKNEK